MNLSGTQFTHCRRGFTLIELMISLALMVLLMLGVNFIFTAVGGATGSAQVLSKIGRDIQAAQNVMANDFNQIAMKDGPTFQITSIVRPAFMNRQDQLSDGDGDPATELLNPTDLNETRAIPAVPGTRSHRLDLLSFFARGNFPRQTGNDDEFISDMSSNEAWLWYGHLRTSATGTFLANKQDPGTPWSPSEPSPNPNPNADNYFASQWILGRVPMLLIEPDLDKTGGSTLNSGGGQISDNSTPQKFQGFVARGWDATSTDKTNLTPFSYSSGSVYTPSGGVDQRLGTTTFGKIQSCRFDIAGINADVFRERLKFVISSNIADYDWWTRIFAEDGSRFQCNPFLIKPLSAASYSQQRPVFLSSCTQFIVEYAGDFIHQNVTTGAPDNWFGDTTPGNPIPLTDGEVDYFPAVGNEPRQIRWYGMPRGTAGRNSVGIANGDVAPLKDTLMSIAPVPQGLHPVWGGAPFERHLPTPSPLSDYIGASGLQFQENTTNGVRPPTVDSSYVCAWGPNDTVRPTLIRIVMVLDDPNGRLKNGLTFEYVFKVQ